MREGERKRVREGAREREREGERSRERTQKRERARARARQRARKTEYLGYRYSCATAAHSILIFCMNVLYCSGSNLVYVLGSSRPQISVDFISYLFIVEEQKVFRPCRHHTCRAAATRNWRARARAADLPLAHAVNR